MATCNLVLIGFRATGKSVVGRLLADKLQFTFIDTDQEVEKRTGKTITQIFQEQGERYFRDVEATMVIHYGNKFGYVISCGGGAILRPGNVEAMKTHGKVIWLTASVETICERLHADPKSATQRPPLTNLDEVQEIRQMLASRARLYRDAADFTIKTDGKTPEDVVEDIIRRCRLSLLTGS